ncbi:MAG: M23 family metallopeptidase [Bacteroidales bacterium]|jgi:murein DD-endopeptidase MepM/ murein hydrolase activator NlpD|nr:M23 family metallopeptidase [Bacteroidales bacterium]
MKRVVILCVAILLVLGAVFFAKAQKLQGSKFYFPLKLKPEPAGSFCELRSDHFHGGVDYRTNQKEGYSLYAMEKGKIVRASVSEKGYGKALYIQYDNGYQSVYAHLKKFNRNVEKLLRKDMRHSGSKTANLINLDIPVKRKQKVAVAGNSGSSSGPHLHLEIRSHYQTPADKIMLYNPQKYFPVTDDVAPKFYYLGVYGISSRQISYLPVPVSQLLSMPQTAEPAGFQEFAEFTASAIFLDTLHLSSGHYAFGISALDTVNNLPFNYGLYRLCFMMDNDTLAYYSLDSFPLSNYSKVSLHTDSEFQKQYKKKMEKSWVFPEDAALSPYSVINNNGICLLEDPECIYTLKIYGSDFNGNTTVLVQPVRLYEPVKLDELKDPR